MKALTLSFLLFTYTISAQFISGKIIDAVSDEPLPYVNIGIVNKNIGTVSDRNGDFFLEVPADLGKDTLRFSMVGFSKKDFILKDYLAQQKSENTLRLEEKITALEGVTVVRKKSDKYKRKVLGNKSRSKTNVGGFTSNYLGNEIGIITRIRKSPTYLQEFNMFIAKNTYGSVLFRLNFYSLKGGIPHENILEEMIVIETDIESGLVSVDLRPYDIVMENDFLVAIEWIEDLGIGDLFFSAGFLGSSLYARATSQGEWTKMGVSTVGMNVEVLY